MQIRNQIEREKRPVQRKKWNPKGKKQKIQKHIEYRNRTKIEKAYRKIDDKVHFLNMNVH